MSKDNEGEGNYSISPGFSVLKNSGKDAGPQSIRRTQRANSAVASIHRSTVTKSFGRKSKSGWDEDDPTKSMEQNVRVSSSRPARLSAMLQSTYYVGDDDDDDTKHFLCVPLTNNVKALFIMMVMFGVISLAQYFAAVAANSQSLKADVVSMAVDALSYLGNILGESSDIPAQRLVLQLLFSAASIILLIYFNTQILVESIEIMRDHKQGGIDEDSDEDEGVEASIVFAFALLGLIFDAICLWAYRHYARLDAEEEYKQMKEAAIANGAGESLDDNAEIKLKKPQVNMLTALLHVSADLMRSSCTFVEGIILLAGGLTASGQEYVDAICGIIIGASLYAASLYALYEWIIEMTGWFSDLGKPIEVYIPELGCNIIIKPDKAGHSKAADAFLA